MITIPLPDPNWQSLYDPAAAQPRLFTTRQAAAAGYSDPLLAHYQKVGRVARIRRGIYRLVQLPSGDQEDLVTAWLWTDSIGVVPTKPPYRCSASQISCPTTSILRCRPHGRSDAFGFRKAWYSEFHGQAPRSAEFK